MRISDWSSDVCSADLESPVQSSKRRKRKKVEKAGLRKASKSRKKDLKAILKAADRYTLPEKINDEIGRASCRERVCQYVSISVVAVTLKKKQRPTTKTQADRVENKESSK